MNGLKYILSIEPITPHWLASKLNVSNSIIYRWMNGKNAIPKYRQREISKIFPYCPSAYVGKELNTSEILQIQASRLSKPFNSIQASQIKKTLLLKRIKLLFPLSNFKTEFDVDVFVDDVRCVLYEAVKNRNEQT